MTRNCWRRKMPFFSWRKINSAFVGPYTWQKIMIMVASPKLLSELFFFPIFTPQLHYTLSQFYIKCPWACRKHKCFLLSQVWFASVLPFQRRARHLDCRFALLASERAGPISKWAEPQVIPSKHWAHDLIWNAEAQPAQDVFRWEISLNIVAITNRERTRDRGGRKGEKKLIT